MKKQDNFENNAENSSFAVSIEKLAPEKSFIKDCQITFLANIKKVDEFSTMSLAVALEDIKNGTYRDLIDALPLPSDGGYREEKIKLPSWGFNGTFESSVTKENLAFSSGMFHFDIDKLTDEELASVKAKLVALPEMVFVFLSPSRNGLKGAIRVQHTIESDADFKMVFAQAEAYFQSLVITIDPSCKDVRRLCFVSYDSDIFINENPVEWAGYEVSATTAKLPAVTTITSPVVNGDTTDECVRRATGILRNAQLGEYHYARLKAGQFAGGVVAGGLVDETFILAALFEVSDEISANHDDDEETINREHQALQDSFAEGMKKPITKLKTQQSLKKLLSHFLPIDVAELNDVDAKSYVNLMAITNVDEYALSIAEILQKTDGSRFVFSFRSCTYCGVIGTSEKIKITKLLDCSIRILYSIQDTDESSPKMAHYIETISEREGIQVVEITANDLVSPQSFKQMLANMRLISSVKNDDLNLLQNALYHKTIAKVRRAKYLGYDEKSGSFVFNQFLYDSAGNRHSLNEQGYFDVGIMPLYDKHCINTVSTWDKEKTTQFVRDVYTAYGNKGLIAMGFWIATAFSHKVFEKYNFFPFISFYGEPHTGKSTLTLLLNRCFFVDAEGLSMSKASTLKGEQRQLSKKSGLVTALLEFNNVESATFDLNMLLGAYNRNAISSRAAYSNDNKTIEIDLRCGLSFVQNFEPFKTSAQKERVISLHFEQDSLDPYSDAFKRLTAYKPEDLTGFGDFIFKHRTTFERHLVSMSDKVVNPLMKKGINIDRIAKNHAVPLAGVLTLLIILGIKDVNSPLWAYTAEIARKKCKTAVSDLDVAEDFFAVIDAVETGKNGVYHESTEIKVRMTDVCDYLEKQHPNQIDIKQLYRELKQHPRFIASNQNTYLKAESQRQKCWRFKP